MQQDKPFATITFVLNKLKQINERENIIRFKYGRNIKWLARGY